MLTNGFDITNISIVNLECHITPLEAIITSIVLCYHIKIIVYLLVTVIYELDY